MAHTQALTHAKFKLIERFFPNASAATVETMEILMDMDQMSMLLASLDEVRLGRVVSMQEAFSDL